MTGFDEVQIRILIGMCKDHLSEIDKRVSNGDDEEIHEDYKVELFEIIDKLDNMPTD